MSASGHVPFHDQARCKSNASHWSCAGFIHDGWMRDQRIVALFTQVDRGHAQRARREPGCRHRIRPETGRSCFRRHHGGRQCAHRSLIAPPSRTSHNTQAVPERDGLLNALLWFFDQAMVTRAMRALSRCLVSFHPWLGPARSAAPSPTAGPGHRSTAWRYPGDPANPA